jgi:signal transduction histidine kinase
MSATATETSVVRRGTGEKEPLGFRVLSAGTSVIVFGVLALGLSQRGATSLFWSPLAWVPLVVAASLVSIPTGRGAALSMDLPLLVGAAIVFPPPVCGMIALLGVTDLRELHRSVSPWLGIYNRAQVAASVMAASVAFRVLGGELGIWPWTAVVGLMALTADSLVNYTLVALAMSFRYAFSFRAAFRELRFGEPRLFIPTYVSFGFLGVLLAEAYSSVGIQGVLAFLAPILLAYEAFMHRKKLEALARSLRVHGTVLQDVDERIVEERRDERLVLAGEIHDEVLPPLYQVHLMGQVLLRDLDSGHLLDLDAERPQLLVATDEAQRAIRSVLGKLRSSSLGPGGLNQTLELLVRNLEGETETRFELDLSDVGGSSVLQFLLYQVAREAIHNAVKHAKARRVVVRLWSDSSSHRLTVEDDGVGFDPRAVDREGHFGLQMIEERVRAAGGLVLIESRLGEGTRVMASLPQSPSD